MRHQDGRIRKRLRAALALVVALWVGAIGVQWQLPEALAHPPHPHPVESGLDHGPAAFFDHEHLENRIAPGAAESIAEAVLPRTSTTVVALVAALSVLTWLWSQHTVAVVRGPPRAGPVTLSGRQLLTRLGIARR